MTVVCGGIVALFPLAAGLGVIFDPYLRKKRASAADDGTGSADSGGLGLIRICPLAALPNDGIPRPFPVIADIVDGWTHATNQRIGLVFLQHTTRADGKPNVVAFSAACPHLGCFVDFNRASSEFECPCHKSAFAKDGKQLYGPSRRGLDELDVKIEGDGEKAEVLVAFQKYQAGIPERKPVG